MELLCPAQAGGYSFWPGVSGNNLFLADPGNAWANELTGFLGFAAKNAYS